MSDKGLVFRIYKEFTNSTMKRQITQLTNEQIYFSKEEVQMNYEDTEAEVMFNIISKIKEIPLLTH